MHAAPTTEQLALKALSRWARRSDGREALVVFVNEAIGQLRYRFVTSGRARRSTKAVDMPTNRFLELFTAVEPVTTGDGARP